MPQEIERKFLVTGNRWQSLAAPRLYRQGYIPTQGLQTVRVRIVGQQGYLTLKGPAEGLTRAEFEYPIPAADAQEMLQTLCEPPLIEKHRYRIPIDDLVWEVDEFFGDNAGLIIAEVELPYEDYPVTLPDWIGEEVSDDPRYYNSNLVKHPFARWDRGES
ncbi:MAG: CYTH domain-containing protein [Cyanobacteria bacterium J06626_23]